MSPIPSVYGILELMLYYNFNKVYETLYTDEKYVVIIQ